MNKINTLPVKGNALREYKQTITLSQIQREAGFARLLSTRLCLHTFGKRSTCTGCSICTKYYLKTKSPLYSANLFVGTPPQVRDIRGGGARDQKLIWVHTYCHPESLYAIFYPIHVPRDKGSIRRGSGRLWGGGVP